MVERVKALNQSIEYIEAHLLETIKISQVAKQSYVSQTQFYQLFSMIFGLTVKEYIRKRRLSLASMELLKTDMTILDLAIKYQYQSYASFSRAFKGLFGLAPSHYRKQPVNIEYFPKIHVTPSLLKQERMAIGMNEKKVYAVLEDQSQGYFFDVDIDGFEKINENFGRKAGDYVLTQVPRRLKKLIKKKTIESTDILRIGADEFVFLASNLKEDAAKKLAEVIIHAFDQPMIYEKNEIKVSVSIGIVNLNVGYNKKEVLNQSQMEMLLAKKNGRNQYSIN